MNIENIQTFLDYNFFRLTKKEIIKDLFVLFWFTLLLSMFWLNKKWVLSFVAIMFLVIIILSILLCVMIKSEKLKRFVFDAIWSTWFAVMSLFVAIKCSEYDNMFILVLLFALTGSVFLSIRLCIKNIDKGEYKKIFKQNISVFVTIGMFAAFIFSLTIIPYYIGHNTMLIMAIIFSLLTALCAISASICYLKIYFKIKYRLIK